MERSRLPCENTSVSAPVSCASSMGHLSASGVGPPGGAAARYPAPTEAEARQSELGWAMSAHFPNVRAWR